MGVTEKRLLRTGSDFPRGALVLMAALTGAAVWLAEGAQAQTPGPGPASAAVPAPADFGAQRRGDDGSDWPCIQRKVARLSAGAVWSGPAIDGLEDEWSKDSNLQDLARTLASRRTSIEEAGKLIAAFSATQDPAGKQRRLTLLFAATFSEIDKLRTEIMKGIERYTRNQRKLARKIDDERAQFQALQQAKDSSEAGKKAAQEKDEQLKWEMRVYKERENSLRYVCENPVILEQRLYQIAQEIQKNM